MSTVLHGKPSTYNRHGCRCDECRTAATDYRRRQRQTHPHARERERIKSDAWNEATGRLKANHSEEFARLLHAARRARSLPTQDPDAALADLLVIESTPCLEQMEGEVSLMRLDASEAA